MNNKIIEELFKKRLDTMSQNSNKELENKISKIAISVKEDEIIELFRQETSEEICKELENLFFYYCNAKKNETTIYNEYYYKLGFADAIKLKQEINKT